MNELERYAAHVRDMAERKDGEVYQNSGHEHARIVINELLSRVTESVDILAGSLKEASYTIDLLKNALGESNGALRVVLEEEHFDPQNVSKSVQFLDNHGVDVKILKADVASHFCVVDRDSFRFEDDTVNSKALFAFGDEELSARLTERFERIWKSETAVPLSEYLTA